MAAQDNTNTIFVDNIPFAAKNEELGKFFEQFGSIKSAKIIFRYNRYKKQSMSLGYGFVVFHQEADKEKALKAKGLTLNNRVLKVVQAKPRVKKPRTQAFIAGFTKELTEKQVMVVFPKATAVKIFNPKEDHKGFGFVTFPSEEELLNAIKGTKEVMIDGEKVVVRFARPIQRKIFHRGHKFHKPPPVKKE